MSKLVKIALAATIMANSLASTILRNTYSEGLLAIAYGSEFINVPTRSIENRYTVQAEILDNEKVIFRCSGNKETWNQVETYDPLKENLVPQKLTPYNVWDANTICEAIYLSTQQELVETQPKKKFNPSFPSTSTVL